MKKKFVTSLKNLKPDRIYYTNEYNLFVKVDANRGEKDSIVKKKVGTIVEMMEDGTFIDKMQFVLINKDGTILDGHHRVMAYEKLGLPVRFMITDADEVTNKSELEIAKVLMKINSVNPQWTSTQAFKTALHYGMEVAHKIEGKIEKVVGKFKNLTRGNFNASKVIGIVLHDIEHLHGKRLDLEIFEDKTLIEKIDSDEFKDDLAFLCSTLDKLYNDKTCGAEERSIVEKLFEQIWKKNLSKENAFTYIDRYGFKCTKGDYGVSVRNRIKDVCGAMFNEHSEWTKWEE